MSIDRDRVAAWLDAYVEAWRSYDGEAIGELFSDDVVYRYHPYDEPLRGRDVVVASWLDNRDEKGTYAGSYAPVAVDGDTAVAVGESTYTEGPGGPVRTVYYNCFVMCFDADGRCSEFTEYFIERPDA